MRPELIAVRTGSCLARAMHDPAYRAVLCSRPAGMLAAAGVPVSGLEITVLEDTSHTRHLVVPPQSGAEAEWPTRALQAVPPDVDRLLERAESDPDLRARLHRDCEALLTEHGIAVPEGTRWYGLQDTETLKHLVMPAATPVTDARWTKPRFGSPHLRILAGRS